MTDWWDLSMTTEPDRPRRDVSMEGAERMPMSEEELDVIEARATSGYEPAVWAETDDILALVAEVRRLRAEMTWTAPEDAVFARGGKPMYWNAGEQRWQREPVENP